MTEKTNEERIPRPEEIVRAYEELPEEQKLQPLRCQAGSATQDGGCPRNATTWMHPEHQDYPLCGEHARANELWLECNEWSVAEEVTGGWLRVARAWGFEELERLALHAHEEAKAGLLKAEARAELATEMADAPRKGRKDKIAELTQEQDEKLQRLINRSDALNNARFDLEDHATGEVSEKRLRASLAALVEEGERAEEEAHRYSEELGIAIQPKE